MKWIHKILGFILVKPVIKILFKLKVSGKENLKGISGPLLIVSNHQFFLDSFAIGAGIPILTDVHPVRTMGEINHFLNPFLEVLRKIRFIKLIYKIFGVFPAIRGVELEKALQVPIDILKNKGVVLLHPEGKIVSQNEIEQFKRGAPALALITKTKVLPIAMKIDHNSKGRRKKYFIKYGEVFSMSEDLTYEEGADYMKNIVVDLYNSLPV